MQGVGVQGLGWYEVIRLRRVSEGFYRIFMKVDYSRTSFQKQ